MKRKGCIWLVLLAIVGVGYWWFFSRGDGEPQSYEVVRVVDGDTIRVRYNGTVEPVRLIGVDSPETVHPDKPVEFYGVEASNVTKNLLLGEREEHFAATSPPPMGNGLNMEVSNGVIVVKTA